ncbi:Propanediol dehydratase small subunit [Raoultella terrigena]|uniref:Propanediol dehydratase small subunit n=1 Tax=Raoultella terrigena TaxID=577 RepID=A0A3P8J1U5_RAOTE|nr:Propanediol dehydratase small subunit [Raoultella terrigena]
MRISRETLEYQAQIAEQMQRHAIARNLRRAGELIAIPDSRILEIYNALRPYRSSTEELLAIADELEYQYQATINAAFIRESAEVYRQRDKLRKKEA